MNTIFNVASFTSGLLLLFQIREKKISYKWLYPYLQEEIKQQEKHDNQENSDESSFFGR